MRKPKSFPRQDSAKISVRHYFWNCGVCHVMHKTRGAAHKCINKHQRMLEREAKPKTYEPFTDRIARDAARIVQTGADVANFANVYRVMESRVIEAVVRARFYEARLKANDGVVRRETQLDSVGFTEETMQAVNAREVLTVGNLMFRHQPGGIYYPTKLAEAQVAHVLAWLGHWPLVKPAFLE